MSKLFQIVSIKAAHGGFGMYDVSGYGQTDSVEDWRDQLSGDCYVLGEDELPEYIKDIRGNIYNEPTIVIACEESTCQEEVWNEEKKDLEVIETPYVYYIGIIEEN